MATDEQIRGALSRVLKAIELRPGIAVGTVKSHTRLDSGVRCNYTNGTI